MTPPRPRSRLAQTLILAAIATVVWTPVAHRPARGASSTPTVSTMSPVSISPIDRSPASPVALGAFIPGAPADPAKIGQFGDRIGRAPAIVAWYEAWGSATAVTGDVIDLGLLQAVAATGAAPMITWEPWDPEAGVAQPAYGLGGIARGDFDAYINSWAYRLAAYGGAVYLRFAHEMNAAWYPWCGGVNGNTPEDYVAAWRHVHDLFTAAGAGNVRWVWSPDVVQDAPLALPGLYPGDDYVDWVAMDGYNFGTSQPWSSWRSFAEVFGRSYGELLALTSRPIMIAETASSEAGGESRLDRRRLRAPVTGQLPGGARPRLVQRADLGRLAHRHVPDGRGGVSSRGNQPVPGGDAAVGSARAPAFALTIAEWSVVRRQAERLPSP